MSEEMKIFKVAGRLCRDGRADCSWSRAAAVLGSARLNRFIDQGGGHSGDGRRVACADCDGARRCLGAGCRAPRPMRARRTGGAGDASLGGGGGAGGAPARRTGPHGGERRRGGAQLQRRQQPRQRDHQLRRRVRAPRPGLCVGNGSCWSRSTPRLGLTRTDGTSLAGPTNVNAIFGDGFRQFTTDPRCHYDPATGTWFAVIAFLNRHIHGRAGRDRGSQIAGSARPLAERSRSTSPIRRHRLPCFGDQPLLGIDAHNVYVSTERVLDPQAALQRRPAVRGRQSDLVAGAAAPSFVHIGPLHADGALAGSVQPAITVGPSNAEYFMSSLDNTGQGDHRIVVWALTHRDLHAGVPRLTKTVIDSQHYAVPPPTRQLGAPTRLDSATIACSRCRRSAAGCGRAGHGPADGGDRPEACSRGLVRGAAVPARRARPGAHPPPGLRCVTGNGALYPAIAGDRNGNAVMGFSVSAPACTRAPGFARIGANVADFGPVPDHRPRHRALSTGVGTLGDYSWAVLDPAARQVWLANEYIPPPSSQTLDGEQNWGTRVYAVRLPG